MPDVSRNVRPEPREPLLAPRAQFAAATSRWSTEIQLEKKKNISTHKCAVAMDVIVLRYCSISDRGAPKALSWRDIMTKYRTCICLLFLQGV
jgi:hypothetical protein